MPTSVGKNKASHTVLAACLSLAGLALLTSSASAQQSGRTEALRTPQEKSFLDPGRTSSNRRSPGYVVDGMVTSPYGPSDRYGNDLLPPSIGGGQPLIGGNKR